MIAFGSWLAGQLAVAHHSTTGMRSSEITEITGKVKEFQFQNPHSWIQVNVTNDRGEVEEWSVEWGIPNSLLRQGYNPSTFPEGAEVTIRLHQVNSGAPSGGFVAARFADGTTIGRWEETN
jgi:hypothetical protein